MTVAQLHATADLIDAALADSDGEIVIEQHTAGLQIEETWFPFVEGGTPDSLFPLDVWRIEGRDADAFRQIAARTDGPLHVLWHGGRLTVIGKGRMVWRKPARTAAA